MCYSTSQTKTEKQLEGRYSRKVALEAVGQLKIFYAVSGFSHPNLPVITSERPEEIQLFKWGLLPSWTKDEVQAKTFASNNLNARSETVFEKPSFRSVKRKRCLIPCTGFYEWRDVNKKKYPHFISLKNEEVFSLGGLYDTWVNKETGEILNTFSIITTEANPLMAKIHNTKLRMPFILPKELEDEWIKSDAPESYLKDLMKPLDESLMQAHTISKRITSRTENPNDPETLKPFDYPELALVD